MVLVQSRLGADAGSRVRDGGAAKRPHGAAKHSWRAASKAVRRAVRPLYRRLERYAGTELAGGRIGASIARRNGSRV